MRAKRQGLFCDDAHEQSFRSKIHGYFTIKIQLFGFSFFIVVVEFLVEGSVFSDFDNQHIHQT